MDTRDTDVLVIGSGAAGLCAAIQAAPRRVLVLAPSGPKSTCTEIALGGIAAPLGHGDSVARHVADTLNAADHSGSEQFARMIIGTAARAIAFLERAGVQFERAGSGRSLHLEAGHGMPRILHADGDRTGAAIHRALLASARACRHVTFCSDASAISLLRGRSGVAGALALTDAGHPLQIDAAETLLATGGLGQLFAATTNVRSASGDGLAMALAVGACVAGLEFVQFHPTALRCGLDPLPLLTEALRGAGAMLVADGRRRFMRGADPREDLAPRDVVARAVWRHLQQGADVCLDARQVFGQSQGPQFPAALAACLAQGIDPATTPIPVTCAAHFHMGGIVVDAHGRSSVPGLWAAGEVAFTGLHGANRLASNSLLEAVVIGSAAGQALAREPHRHRPALRQEATPAILPWAERPLWQTLRRVMWDAMGPVRNGADLAQALEALEYLRDDLPADDPVLRQRLSLARAMIGAALRRTESRGAHWRSDHAGRIRALDGPGALCTFSLPELASVP